MTRWAVCLPSRTMTALYRPSNCSAWPRPWRALFTSTQVKDHFFQQSLYHDDHLGSLEIWHSGLSRVKRCLNLMYVYLCVVRVEVCAVTCSSASAAHTPAGAEGAGSVCQHPHQHADAQHTCHGQKLPLQPSPYCSIHSHLFISSFLAPSFSPLEFLGRFGTFFSCWFLMEKM